MADPAFQLLDAVNAGDAVALEAALAAGADPDRVLHESGFTALHSVCSEGDLACVRALLAAGANPNAAMRRGRTPLHIAADLGPQCTQALLAAGANPNAAMEDGTTALHMAAERGHTQCTQALLAAGANPNAAGHDDWTPLFLAAERGNTQCIQALLAAGANPAAVTARGSSPLVAAVTRCRVEAATALLQAAPELALLRDKYGLLPLELAVGAQHFAAARCVLEHGALPPAAGVLALLEAAWLNDWVAVLPLYAPLVARQPLTPSEWARVPNPCPGLSPLLPAVLARSEAEAALLVARLPAADRERLRTAALCLRRTEHEHGLELPPAILRPLLLAAVE